MTFVVSRNKAPVERTEAAMNGSYTASVTVTGTGSGGGEAGDINLNVDATPDGTLVVAKQTLQMTTNAPNGAEVYVSGGAETGMVLAGGGGGSVGGSGSTGGFGGGGTPGGVPGSGGSSSDKLNRHTASVSNPAVLNVNTWGYAVPSDITGNGVSMAEFGETSAYQTAADNTNAGSVIGGGAGSLKFAGVRVADSGSPVTMEKIYAGATKNFPVYLGMLVGSNLAQGNYETNIYYTVIVEASDVAGGEIVVEPGEVAPAGGETITVTSSLKPGTNNSSNVFGDGTTIVAGDVKVKIGGEDCTDVAVTSNAGENLKVTCKTPAKGAGKYGVELKIEKAGKTYTKPEGITYRQPTQMDSLTTMQDAGLIEKCTNSPEGTVVRLKDTRDNNYYNVVRAKDGKCWMAENLKLHLKSSTPLTPATSDVSSNWTPTHNTGTGSTGPTFSDYYKEYSHDFATANYGVHYTWVAATAGKGNSSVTTQGQNINDSICPKGWKLPRSGPNTDVNNDFYNLVAKYGGNGSTGSSNLRNTNTLSFPLSGNYNYSNGQLNNASSNGYFWSSTVYNSNHAYHLDLYSSGVRPQYYSNRHYGFSVRCVARMGDITSATYMQDVTKEMCDNTKTPDSPTGTHIQKTLIDKRDNKTYRVVKAYDGRCWMAENLRFHLTSGTALTPETSDVISNWTPNHTTQTGGSTPGWPSNTTGYNNPRSHDTGNTEYGVYYNWNAATAGSGNSSTNTQGQNVPNSVCPKGWKLPRMDKNGNQDINDYEKLTVSYGGNAYTGNNALGASRLRSAPLSFPLSGYYLHGGSIYSQGSRGYFWSSTVYGSSNGFLMNLDSGNVLPRNWSDRSLGWSVRCVVREPEPITSATYMQDVTKEMCDATPMPDSATGMHVQKTLIDKRDNKTYRVVKAYDGKCWMAENLKLRLSSNTPLTPATSDVSSNWTPTHNTGTGSSGPRFGSNDYYREYSHDFTTANYGVHYTWAAATAGKGNSSVTSAGQNVNDSICPKAWKLPRSGPSTDVNNDFYNLVVKYGGNNSTGSSNLRNISTLSSPLSGFYNYSNGQLRDASSDGYFWSSTVHNADSAYNLRLSSGNVLPQNYANRHYGLSVRCLVR